LKDVKNEADDRLLVEAAQKDHSRFAALYERHFDVVYAFVVRQTRDRDAAQDITSEVFHDALANIGRFEWRGIPFLAWLLRIASNAVADHFHSSARNRKIKGLDERFEVQLANLTTDILTNWDPYARVFRSVKELPDDQRRVVEMRFAEEKSIGEIARAIGRSEGAVKQLQFRALETLRDMLAFKPAKKPQGKSLSKSGKKSGGRNG
jgi:RNA polymerase sigma-70 factor (ECF subfamily)